MRISDWSSDVCSSELSLADPAYGSVHPREPEQPRLVLVHVPTHDIPTARRRDHSPGLEVARGRLTRSGPAVVEAEPDAVQRNLPAPVEVRIRNRHARNCQVELAAVDSGTTSPGIARKSGREGK